MPNPSAVPAVRPHRILLVDDSATIRTLTKLYLLEQRVECLEAGDGAQALAILQHEQVDLVIADVNMRGMDGLSLVRELRAHARPELRTLPVLVLTSNQDIREAHALQAGASAFARKPIAKERLLELVGPLLERAG